VGGGERRGVVGEAGERENEGERVCCECCSGVFVDLVIALCCGVKQIGVVF